MCRPAPMAFDRRGAVQWDRRGWHLGRPAYVMSYWSDRSSNARFCACSQLARRAAARWRVMSLPVARDPNALGGELADHRCFHLADA